MRQTTVRRKDGGAPEPPAGGEFPDLASDKTFFGARETDIIAIEEEARPRTTARRKAGEPREPGHDSG